MTTTRSPKISLNLILAILAAGLMSFSGVIVETAMNITFPTLMTDMHVTTSTVQWMTTGYLLVVAIIVPISATLKRNFRTKTLFIIANLLFLAGLIIDVFAPTFPILLAGRLIQGFGTGIALPLMFNIILEQVPLSKIGQMMGIGTLITAVAPAIGPTFGGLVVARVGWRYIFVTLIPLILISLIMGITTIKQVSTVQRSALDWLSLLSVAAGFTGLILGFNQLSEAGWLSPRVLGPIVVGLAALVFLVFRSLHIENPIIHMESLNNSTFLLHLVAFFLLQFITIGMSFLLPNYIQLVNHQSAFQAGLTVLPGPALGAVMAPFGGQLLDRFGAKRPIMASTILYMVALSGFAIFAQHLSVFAIAGLYTVLMFGAGLGFGNTMTNGLKQLSPAAQADGKAVMNTIQQFAGATGTAIVSTLVALSQTALKASGTVIATATGTQHAFIVLLIGSIIAFGLLFKALFTSNKA